MDHMIICTKSMYIYYSCCFICNGFSCYHAVDCYNFYKKILQKLLHPVNKENDTRTVNQLLFLYEKFLQGSCVPCHCEYFKPRIFQVYTQQSDHKNKSTQTSLSMVNCEIKLSQINVGLQWSGLSLYNLITKIAKCVTNKIKQFSSPGSSKLKQTQENTVCLYFLWLIKKN